MVPGDRLGAVTWKQGLSDLAATIKVQHVTPSELDTAMASIAELSRRYGINPKRVAALSGGSRSSRASD